jgi:ketosteroid isomerase-like protein
MLMCDLPPPLQCKGIEAYAQTCDLFFCYNKPGTAFDIQELAVTAGNEVAFAGWRIALEHHSEPATD